MNPLDKLPVKFLKARGPKGKQVTVLVDGDYDGEWFSTLKLRVMPQGQIQVVDRSITENNHWVYLHHLVLPLKPGFWVEHINGNKADNRSANLRYITPKDVMKKRTYPNGHGIHLNGAGLPNKHGFMGVVLQSGRWIARCRSKYLGTFPSKEDAARAYDKEVLKLLGDNAILNFPDERSLEMKVSDKEFERIKQMQGTANTGPSISDTARIFNRPAITISRIYRANTIEEYRQGIIEERKKYSKNNKPATNPKVNNADELLDTILEVKANIDTLVTGLAEVQKQIKLIPKRRAW